MATTSRLLQLPPEIIIDILSYLSPHDLRSCQLTNREPHMLIRCSVLLQYKTALETAQAEDNPCSLAPYSEKIEDLRSSEEAWSMVKPKFAVSIPVKHHPSGIYDLTGGTYLLGNVDRKTLHYLKLPRTPYDDTRWRSVRVDRTIIDMGLCVFEHDLIAIVTTHRKEQIEPALFDIELTLREFSSDRRHPQAKEERILVMTSPYEKPAIGIEIVGDNLVLILTFYNHRDKPDDRVFIYEWRTSVLKASFSAPWHTYAGLIFLSEHLVLLPNTHENCLEIFRIPFKPTIESLTPILTLSLPRLAEGRSLTGVSCRAEPNPIGASSRIDKRQRAQERLDAGIVDVDDFQPTRGFLASATDAICVFAVRINGIPVAALDGNGGFNLHFAFANAFTFFVHRRSFLNLVHEHEGADAPIPWPEWGPPVSRWFNANTFPTRWITTTAGQRCVVIAEAAPETGFPYVVLDFNKDNVRRMKKKLAEEKEEHDRSPTVEMNHMTYEEELEAELDEAAAALFAPSPLAGPDLQDEPMDEDDEHESDSSSEVDVGRPSRIWCVETSEKVDAPETFVEEVSGELPYVAAASEGRYAFDGVLLDEERIIGIRTDIMDDIKYIDVHYFG
ncbi:unnamed protein product [Cyclocybe aegerita]|uniref:F-box domain-containing protein n=1 Tax=Cyclocybe aegerita TaxID=1973307 RepID=A0A8S0VQV4_CYCAE|nr:unnamed protein product [Cyclocybe aegerita]